MGAENVRGKEASAAPSLVRLVSSFARKFEWWRARDTESNVASEILVPWMRREMDKEEEEKEKEEAGGRKKEERWIGWILESSSHLYLSYDIYLITFTIFS